MATVTNRGKWFCQTVSNIHDTSNQQLEKQFVKQVCKTYHRARRLLL